MTVSITDFSHFSGLRQRAGSDDPQALREVAGQFEALFIQTLLKNMRDASLGDGLLGGSDQQKMYEGMLDQQLSLEMAGGRGIGIAEMLVRQLGGAADNAESTETGASSPAAVSSLNTTLPGPLTAVPPAAPTADVTVEATPVRRAFESAESFVRELWPHARKAAKALGVEARAIVAQAALETGWGKHMPETARGDSSLNLFGIKAGRGWGGESAEKPTLEFDNGVARREVAKFRAYETVADSVEDYINFLRDNPRYDGVRMTDGTPAAFGRSLAEAGYATDPRYAEKIDRVAASERMSALLTGLEGAEPPIGRAGDAAAP